VSNIGTHLTKLGSDVTKVQDGLASVTQQVRRLQSKVEFLATRSFAAGGSTSASASASYSGSSGDSYSSRAGHCRAKSISGVAVVWFVVTYVAALVR
jgi:hypothetical protein